ncbi:hypothetical protein V5O48_016585 [Marasmius crinis-equi]|uniref:Uncharacterized protein n=1 Tax=Marasmius crinis-equi TaxID=585013 RepID=A0ABR3ERA3_9AGAR
MTERDNALSALLRSSLDELNMKDLIRIALKNAGEEVLIEAGNQVYLDMKRKRDDLEDELREVKKKKMESKAVSELRTQLTQSENTVDILQSKVAELHAEINSMYKYRLDQEEEVKELNETVTELKKRQDETLMEIMAKESDIRDMNACTVQLETELAELEDKLENYYKTKRENERWTKWAVALRKKVYEMVPPYAY